MSHVSSQELSLPSEERKKYRHIFNGVMALIPESNRLDTMIELLSEAVQAAVAVAAEPKAIRKALEIEGQSILARLIRANRDSFLDGSTVVKKFGIANSTLHRKRNSGAVIAYRPNEAADYMYPVEQFEEGDVRRWARDVVDAVGNGGAAIHLLYVPRKRGEHGERSIAEEIRDNPESGAVHLSKVLKSLTEE